MVKWLNSDYEQISMKRLFKIILGLLVGLFAFTLAAILIIMLFIDPNDYKPQITELVKNQTGRELTIEGDITLTFFPTLGLQLGKTQLGNAPEFTETTFAQVDQANLQIKLLPLFQQQLEIGHILLNGAELRLIRQADGTTNWQDLLQSDDASEESFDLATLTIAGITLENSHLLWDNRQLDERYEFSDINLETSAFSIEKPLDLQLSSYLDHRSPTQTLQGKMDLTTRLILNPKAHTYRLTDSVFDLETVKSPYGQQKIHTTIQQADLDLAAEKLDLTAITMDGLHTQLRGDVQITDITQQPTITGHLQMMPFQPRKLITALQLPPPNLPEKLLQKAEFKTAFTFNTDGTGILEKIHLQIDDNQLEIPQLSVNLLEERLDSEKMTLSAFGVNLVSNLNIINLLSAPQLKARLVLDSEDFPQTWQQFAQPLPLPAGIDLKPAKLTAELALDNEQVILNNLQLKIPKNQLVAKQVQYHFQQQQADIKDVLINWLGIQIQAGVKANFGQTQPQIQGHLNTTAFNLKQLWQALQIGKLETQNPDMLTQLKIDTQLKTDLTHLQLKGLKLQLDNSLVSGQLMTESLEKPHFNFNLAVDKLNVDDYLPPSEDNAKEDKEQPLLPLELLRALKLDGQLKIGKLTAAQLEMEDVHLQVKAKDGKIDIAPLDAKLYQGAYHGQLSLQAQHLQPTLKINNHLQNVAVQSLLQTLAQLDVFTGSLETQANLHIQGTTWTDFLEHLQGEGHIHLVNGSLEGINLGESIRRARALIKNEPWTESEEPLRTDFSSLSGQFTIKGRVIHNQMFRLKSPLLRAEGQGIINLATQQVDYQLKAALVETTKGQGGKELEDLNSIAIPFQVTGLLTQPSITPRLVDLTIDSLKKQRDELLKDEAINQYIEGVLKDLPLDKLFQ